MNSELSTCELEPIHVPGKIQAFGTLIVCDLKRFEILQMADNAFKFLGADSKTWMGRNLWEALDLAPISLLESGDSYFAYGSLNFKSYLYQGVRIFEVERTPASDAAQVQRSVRACMEKLQAQNNLSALVHEAAVQFRNLCGFDRVMIYRFHPDFHGEVVGESVAEGVDSYMGLHFPASDIPVQARQIFLQNWLRMIPDVSYRPEKISPEINPHTGRALDLGQTLLRSVSPIHLEYLRNMRVNATLTVSILSEGKLWGLVACHHLSARYLDETERGACEMLGRYLSTLVRDVSGQVEQKHRAHLREIHHNLVARIQDSTDIARDLSCDSPNLLDLIESEASAASLYLEGHWVNVGLTPSNQELDALVEWLVSHHAGEAVFFTDHLAEHYLPAKNFVACCSGLLAIAIPKTPKNYILLFRPEIIQTVSWAGAPEKTMPASDGLIHPRHSFSEWRESVKNKSSSWESWHVDAALELRSAILALDLKQQFAKEQKARQEAELAIRAREELMAVLSHDLKNPIGSIQLTTTMLERYLQKGETDKMKAPLQRILSASQNMDSLINDILHVTQLEAGLLEINAEPRCLKQVIAEAIELLLPLATHRNLTLKENPFLKPCQVKCDHDRILQVLSNLIGNAIKFCPDNGLIEVSIDNCGPEKAQVSVSDNGPGIPLQHHKFIFDRFWQANQAKRLGTGLGLAISKGIVESHGGEIWVKDRPGGGTIFCFTIPLA